MLERRIPEWLRHAPTPGVRGFAVLSGLEAIARGILIAVMPLTVYGILKDAQLVSMVYFLVGLLSLLVGLLVPWMSRFVPRRYLYSAGCLTFISGNVLAMTGTTFGIIASISLLTVATVVTFISINAYLLDYINKSQLGKVETSKLFYSALGWTLGPGLGVTLQAWWAPAPFLISAAAAFFMLVVFLYLRLGNGKLITRARKPTTSPLAFLPRFIAQPRLVAGWLFAVIRSCGWWVYVVYMPIFVVQSGYASELGGWLLSLTNGTLFVTPLMLRWMQRRSVRTAVRTGFAVSGTLFISATLVSGEPSITLMLLWLGSSFLILLDVSAGLPFLLAVKPSERTEMSAIYASFRDVSGVLTPGAVWILLAFGPLSSVFAASGVALLGCWVIAGKLHPNLGKDRILLKPEPQMQTIAQDTSMA